MIWTAYFVFAFLILRFFVGLTNLVTRQWLGKTGKNETERSGFPLISVLIPARNEEKKIGNLLHELVKQDYSNLEILVYDDLSEDRTAEVTGKIANDHENIKLIRGTDLPGGWLGKNHACHQLGKKAGGKYLLFLDSDVSVTPFLIQHALAHVQKYRLDLLSIFPRQKMVSFGEKNTVPVMNWVLVGLLPLIMTRISSRPSFSAANGQFMFFRSETYHRYEFHRLLKEEPVEDIGIFRVMKKKGLRTHTILSNGDISCRMYGSWREAVDGFSRNVTEFFGGSILAAILFSLVTSLGFIPVLFYLPWYLNASFFLILALHRINISGLSRQPAVLNLLLAPLQQVSFFIMILFAIRNRLTNKLIWKGRNIYGPGIKIQIP